MQATEPAGRPERAALGLPSKLVAVLAVSTATGCQSDGRAVEPSVSDSAGIMVVTNPAPVRAVTQWELEPEPTLIVGSEDRHPLHRVSGILLLTDGSIAVANSLHEILFFDAAGNLTARAGASGSGPGEFRRLASISRLRDNEVAAYNDYPPRMAVFAADGSLVREFGFDRQPDSPQPLDNGTWLGGMGSVPPLTDLAGIAEAEYHILRFSADGILIDTVTTLRGRQVYGTRRSFLSVPFGPTPRFAVAGSHVFVGWSGTYEIGVYTADGQLVRLLRSAAPAPAVTDDMVAQLAAEQQRRRSGSVVMQEGGTPPVEPPVPDVVPSFNRLLATSSGELWVQTYELPGDVESEWHVYGADGRIAGWLRLPPNFSIRDVAGDRVAGIWTDDLDVQTVRVYRIVSR